MSDILSRFTTKVGSPPGPEAVSSQVADSAAPTAKRTYQALRPEPQNRRTPARLRINFGNGRITLLSYAFLNEVACPSPEHLILIYAHNIVITLVGRRLDTLLDHLQEDKARTLTCFNARWHDPPEEGVPIITEIHRSELEELKDMETPTMAQQRKRAER